MKIFFLLLFILSIYSFASAEDWPKWRGIRGNGTWNGPPIVKDLKDEGLNRVWKVSVHPGYSGVTVKENSVFLMGRPPVKNGKETERVLCVDRKNGEKIWEFIYPAEYKKLDYDKGPRASLTLEEDRVFGLGAMGHAFCLDIKSGKKIWLRDLVKEEKCTFPIWGFSASPDILGGNVIYHVGGQVSGNILALDIMTGETMWTVGKDKKAGYAPPLLIESEGERKMICWGPNKIMGLPVG